MADHLRAERCIDASVMALQHRRPGPGLVHHGDRGGRYAPEPYRKLRLLHGIEQSMSRKGDCLDDAPMESFFASLKQEHVHHARFRSRAQSRAAVFEHVEVVYDRQRLHSALGYRTPIEARAGVEAIIMPTAVGRSDLAPPLRGSRSTEAEVFWKGFLRSLADRGPRGVRLVIADDHEGLRAATSKVFHAGLQRCRAHRLRNALAHVPVKQRPAVTAMLKTIFAQETAADARARWSSVADALRERAPKPAASMDEARDDVLADTAFPREHWTQIASTHPLERLNAEIERRTDVVGIFPDTAAVVGLVGAPMLEQNDAWAVCRRYTAFEDLAACGVAPNVMLPAVAA